MNRKYTLLTGFVLCRLMLSATFTPEEARRVYDESSIDFASSSSVEVGGYVFMEVKWSAATPEDEDVAEMSALMDAIQAYVAPVPVICTNSPFSKSLTAWLIPETEFNIPNIQSSVLKSETTGGRGCEVVALDASALKKARSEAWQKSKAVNSRTETEWFTALKEVSKQFKTAEQKRQFFILLGCPMVNYVLCKEKYEKGIANDEEGERGLEEVEKVVQWKPSDDSVFATHKNLLWCGYKNDGSELFYPSWREDDGGRFAEAERLYREGKDIPRIIELLSESIALNPIGYKKWLYLGGVLKASDKTSDALIAYVQALKFNAEDKWAWKGLLDCCKKLGMKTNAKGLSWYLKLRGIK